MREDIGMHPDTRSMSPDQKNYETECGDGDTCTWCEEGIEEIYAESLECLMQLAIDQDTQETHCGGCGAKLKITYLFVPLAYPHAASIEFEIEATKKVV